MARVVAPAPVERRLTRTLARAVRGFDLIAPGDRILVAMSGGKDSYVLHELLVRLARRAPICFEVVAAHIDQGQPGHDATPLIQYMQAHDHALHVEREHNYAVARARIATDRPCCSLCSRLRRAILYRLAGSLGCTKIALGHHREDVLATLMLNLIFSGQLKAMPPKLVSDDGQHVVIRPLVYCAESDIADYASIRGFPVLPRHQCDSRPDQQRLVAHEMLASLERRYPGVRSRLLAAVSNVRPSHLLDTSLWAKLGLRVASEDA